VNISQNSMDGGWSGSIWERNLEGGGFSRGEVRNMLPAAGLGFIEAKSFEGGPRDNGHRLGKTVLRIKRDLKVLKHMGE